MNNFTRDKLEKLGIYELRTVARQVGVYSPTTLKKNELISQILDIASGKEKPYQTNEKRGRPPKVVSAIGEIKEIFLNGKETDEPYKFNNRSKPKEYVCANSRTSIKEYQQKLCGYFKYVSKNEGFVLNTINNVFTVQSIVSGELIQRFSLKTGDYLTYIGSSCTELGDISVVDDILSINNISFITRTNRVNYEDLPYEYSRKRIDLASIDYGKVNYKVLDRISPLFLGARLIINNQSNDFKIDQFASIVDKLNSCNVESTVMCIGEKPEEVSNIINILPNSDIIYKKPTQSADSLKDEFLIKFEHLLRQVEDGNNVVLILNDYNRAENFIANYISLNEFIDKDEALVKSSDKLNSFFKYGKMTNNGGSFSIIVLNCNNPRMLDSCNTFWLLNTVPYKDTDIVVNLKECYTKFISQYNYYDEYLALKGFRDNLNDSNAISSLEKLFE